MNPLSVPPTPEDHVRGSLSARVVIVEYGDYDCPHTRRAHAILLRLIEETPEEVALVFRHFPLRHLHANAQALAEIAEVADRSGKFWELHDRLMALPRMIPDLALEEVRAVGLDLEAVKREVEGVADRVERDVQNGRKDGVHSTPSFFFNGQPHDGHYDFDTLRGKLQAALRHPSR